MRCRSYLIWFLVQYCYFGNIFFCTPVSPTCIEGGGHRSASCSWHRSRSFYMCIEEAHVAAPPAAGVVAAAAASSSSPTTSPPSKYTSSYCRSWSSSVWRNTENVLYDSIYCTVVQYSGTSNSEKLYDFQAESCLTNQPISLVKPTILRTRT